MRLTCLAMLLSAAALTLEDAVAADPSRTGGILELRVVDSCGGPIRVSWVDPSRGEPARVWWVDSFRDEKGREMKGVFRGDTAREIPYGTYRMRVLSVAFLPYESSIAIRQKVTTHLIGLTFAGIENSPPSFDIRGRFAAPPAPGAWCKLSGIYTGNAYFDTIKPGGRFLFPFVPVASYVLLCQHNSDVLTLRRVEMCHGEIEEIVVPAPEAKLPR